MRMTGTSPVTGTLVTVGELFRKDQEAWPCWGRSVTEVEAGKVEVSKASHHSRCVLCLLLAGLRPELSAVLSALPLALASHSQPSENVNPLNTSS